MEGPTGFLATMVKPHFIPRTLRGVGGVKLFNIPGVVYPKEILRVKEGLDKKSGRPYASPPVGWGVTTTQAARMLGSSVSAARAWLHRHRVPYRIVCEEKQSTRLFWHKKRIETLMQKRLPILKQRPAEMLSSAEALHSLGVGRSTLYRYEKRGLLSVTKVRKPSAYGMRPACYYKRAEVEKLRQYLSAIRSNEAKMSTYRTTHRPSQRPPQPPCSTPQNPLPP